ncbi:LysR family transcriptional regulator [Klebsiella pneumoniae]|nr:LysR family transcriptional regulator [Klebsiella pneumoniae]
MDRVIAAQVYLRICELGSLSAAARALGMSRPMVSRYLEQMESWAGARADPSLNPAADADPGRGEGVDQDPRFDADRR